MIEQRSPEWFAQRTKRITASRVGAILGHSPYATADDVMRDMVRETLGAEREFTGNVATQWGTAMEAGAIAEFEMDTGLRVEKTGFHPYEDWAGASPDGLIGDDAGLEMKCPYFIRNDPAPIFKTLHEQPHYEDQVQFTMVCLDRPRWYFAQWTPYGSSHMTIRKSQEWADKNMPILRQFYARFLSEIENPEEHLSPKRTVIDTPDAAMMVREHDDLKEARDRADERLKEIVGEMAALAGDKNALFSGRKLTKIEKEGAVSYAKVVKEKLPGLDLSAWRGKPSSFWKLS